MTTLMTLALLLGGCTDGNTGVCDSCEGTVGSEGTTGTEGSTEECCDDTGGTEVQTATLQVDVTVLGEPVDCNVNVHDEDGDYMYTFSSLETDQPLEGTYILTLGATAEATGATDGLPIHTEADDWQWISPEIEVTLTAGEDLTLDGPMNLYPTQGKWTCWMSEFNGSSTAEIEYTEGNLVYFEGIGDIEVNGTSLSYVQGSLDSYGEFTDPSYAMFEWSIGSTESGTWECWAGNKNDRP